MKIKILFSITFLSLFASMQTFCMDDWQKALLPYQDPNNPEQYYRCSCGTPTPIVLPENKQEQINQQQKEENKQQDLRQQLEQNSK